MRIRYAIAAGEHERFSSTATISMPVGHELIAIEPDQLIIECDVHGTDAAVLSDDWTYLGPA